MAKNKHFNPEGLMNKQVSFIWVFISAMIFIGIVMFLLFCGVN